MSDPIAIAPVVISQDTCRPAFGVSPRWYLDRANDDFSDLPF